MAEAGPRFKKTMNTTVWFGASDEYSVASAMDWYDHLGQVWLVFSQGKDPAAGRRFRESAMREIMRRWPNTLSLPIMPTGAIPNHRDLVKTPDGYIVNPAAAHLYQMDAHARVSEH